MLYSHNNDRPWSKANAYAILLEVMPIPHANSMTCFPLGSKTNPLPAKTLNTPGKST